MHVPAFFVCFFFASFPSTTSLPARYSSLFLFSGPAPTLFDILLIPEIKSAERSREIYTLQPDYPSRARSFLLFLLISLIWYIVARRSYTTHLGRNISFACTRIIKRNEIQESNRPAKTQNYVNGMSDSYK